MPVPEKAKQLSYIKGRKEISLNVIVVLDWILYLKEEKNAIKDIISTTDNIYVD